jgi:alkylation response protein AidB-like acyl-CoA dehydrogenase
MTTLPADERTALAESVRTACERLAPEERVRSVAFDREGRDKGFDRELWHTLCRQVGVAAVGVPERLGGAGYGARAQAVIAHELGRVLAPVPFLPSAVMATEILVAATAPADVLNGLIDGERTAAVVVEIQHGRWDFASTAVTAQRKGDGWSLRGSVHHVLNGSAADDLVVIAIVDSEPAIFVTDCEQPGVGAVAERVLDGTRPMATITLTDVSAERLAPDLPVDHIVDRSLHHTLAVLSAEQVGAGERVLDMATNYARTRKQFDRLIGSFQAVKHRCADMLVDLEMARSASMAALQSVDDDDGEATWRVSMAKAVCSETLRDTSHANLQIHGGIGFTWEHAAGLYVRRARTDEVLFGLPGEHWERLASDAGVFRDPEVHGNSAKTPRSVAS